MATRLQPDPEPLVFEQHHTPWSDDDARPGHVDDVGFLIERGLQPIKRLQERHDRVGLSLIDRHPGCNV